MARLPPKEIVNIRELLLASTSVLFWPRPLIEIPDVISGNSPKDKVILWFASEFENSMMSSPAPAVHDEPETALLVLAERMASRSVQLLELAPLVSALLVTVINAASTGMDIAWLTAKAKQQRLKFFNLDMKLITPFKRISLFNSIVELWILKELSPRLFRLKLS